MFKVAPVEVIVDEAKDAAPIDDSEDSAFRTPPCQRDFGRLAFFVVYSNYSAHGHATDVLRCFAHSRGYHFLLVQPWEDPRVQSLCGGLQDIFFLKHCAALAHLADFEWLFVADADTAVLNPDHCLEEWLDPRADLVLYERMFSGELAAGNYLVQNTAGGRSFLRGWAAMEVELREPEWQTVFTSSDNGMLHIHILRSLFPDRPGLETECWELLRGSRWADFDAGLGAFVRCAKTALLSEALSPLARVRVKVLPRCQAWVRDAALTGFDLHPGDFLGHGLKGKEPFDPAQLDALASFAQGTVPAQCFSPAWRPRLAQGEMDTTNNMRGRLAELGRGFAMSGLRPLYADPDFEECWPKCLPAFQNFL